MSNSLQYWASKIPQECAHDAESRIDAYFQALNTTGRLDLYIMSYAYYNAILAGSANQTGVQGFSTLSINHYRNFLTHLVNLTTDSRPAFAPRATNTAHKSQVQTILARDLLDYYMRDKHLEEFLRKAVEAALLYGEAFLLSEWDSADGEVYGIDPETKIKVREGDIKYSVCNPLDVIRAV